MPNDRAKHDILQSMPGTVAELVKKSGWHRTTVERWLSKLRMGEPEQRASHIIDWRRPQVSGPFVPVYGVGPGTDMVCPYKPKTSAEDWALAKERYGVDLLRAKERARTWTRKARRFGDPLVHAICRPVRQDKV